MTPEQKAAYIMAQAAALNAHVAGMVAGNQKSIEQGWLLKHNEGEFEAVAKRYCVEHDNAVITFFRER